MAGRGNSVKRARLPVERTAQARCLDARQLRPRGQRGAELRELADVSCRH
jgi:hypothetical protein